MPEFKQQTCAKPATKKPVRVPKDIVTGQPLAFSRRRPPRPIVFSNVSNDETKDNQKKKCSPPAFECSAAEDDIWQHGE